MKYFFFSFIFAFLLWLLLISLSSQRPTINSQWVYDAYSKKESISSQIKKRKIVIVAGSNALFGIDSHLLSKTFHKPVLNDGVNAGIGLPCILYMAKKVINDGDIVLLPLEYPMYSYNGEPGVQMIDFVLSREPNCFFQLTLKEQFYMLWHTTFKHILESFFHPSLHPVTNGLYGAHHIDANGDQFDNTLQNRSEALYNEVLVSAKNPQKYGKDFNTNALGWSYLEKFMVWAKKHHVKVIFMPSTLLWHPYYKKDPKEYYFYTHLAQEVKKRGWCFVGKPYEYMYPKEAYFNTNYHLIDSSRRKRTLQIIQDIKTSNCKLFQ